MKIKWLVAALVSIFVFSTTVFADAKIASTKSGSKNYLFVQSAHEAELIPIKPEEGIYKLKLIQVYPYVSYFTDRPNRDTGLMPVEKFMQAWKAENNNGFKKNAPNVNVEGIHLHGVFQHSEVNLIFALTNPQFDQKTNTIIFNAKALVGEKMKLPKRKITLRNVVLFIDNSLWCPGCCCG